MISRILYGKRFFPYYTQVILGGLDEEGTPVTLVFPFLQRTSLPCASTNAAFTIVFQISDVYLLLYT